MSIMKKFIQDNISPKKVLESSFPSKNLGDIWKVAETLGEPRLSKVKANPNHYYAYIEIMKSPLGELCAKSDFNCTSPEEALLQVIDRAKAIIKDIKQL